MKRINRLFVGLPLSADLATLGVTVGSAAGGLLFDVAALPGASLVLIPVLTALGVLLGLGLPQLLVRRNATAHLEAT